MDSVTLFAQVLGEYERACELHGRFPTFHHGLAVIEEEVHEFRLEVYKKHPNPAALREEAIQIAASAIRFIQDCL